MKLFFTFVSFLAFKTMIASRTCKHVATKRCQKASLVTRQTISVRKPYWLPGKQAQPESHIGYQVNNLSQKASLVTRQTISVRRPHW